MDISKEISFLVENWDKIPESFKTHINRDYWQESFRSNIPGVAEEDHEVILLLNRQKPSVEASWDFDMERITVSKTGKVVWGFDSGCSCPSPYEDHYPDCYSCSTTWKEFELDTTRFDSGWEEEVIAKIEEVKAAIV